MGNRTGVFFEINFHLNKFNQIFIFLQRTQNGFLLLGSRCYYIAEGQSEKNAIFTDLNGQILDMFCFGDGISHVIADSHDRITTGYFDEGIYGNYGWNSPIGSSGLVSWNLKGKQIWENDRYGISDVYVMNIDDFDNIWFYYYTDFQLMKTNFETFHEFYPGISGSHLLFFKHTADYIGIDGGYEDRTLYAIKIEEDKLNQTKEKLSFVYENREFVNFSLVSRGSKILLIESLSDCYISSWS